MNQALAAMQALLALSLMALALKVSVDVVKDSLQERKMRQQRQRSFLLWFNQPLPEVIDESTRLSMKKQLRERQDRARAFERELFIELERFGVAFMRDQSRAVSLELKLAWVGADGSTRALRAALNCAGLVAGDRHFNFHNCWTAWEIFETWVQTQPASLRPQINQVFRLSQEREMSSQTGRDGS